MFLQGALLGLLGSFINEILSVYEFRRDNLIWPWQNKGAGITLPFYLFGVGVKFLIAFFVVGMLASSGAIKSNWFAVLTGACADAVFAKAVAIVREQR